MLQAKPAQAFFPRLGSQIMGAYCRLTPAADSLKMRISYEFFVIAFFKKLLIIIS